MKFDPFYDWFDRIEVKVSVYITESINARMHKGVNEYHYCTDTLSYILRRRLDLNLYGSLTQFVFFANQNIFSDLVFERFRNIACISQYLIIPIAFRDFFVQN